MEEFGYFEYTGASHGELDKSSCKQEYWCSATDWSSTRNYLDYAYIQEVYPNHLSHNFFHPPIHLKLNCTRQDEATIAGQTARGRDQPSSCGCCQQTPGSSPAQVAGIVGVENPSNHQPVHSQESGQQDDIAVECCCLHTLSNIPVMVIYVFQKYICSDTGPLYAAVFAQPPTVKDQSVPERLANGECDVVIIHRVFVLVIGEIKSAVRNHFFRSQTPGDQAQLIIKQIRKAVKQLCNQEVALRHLVSDLPPNRITKTLMLPNITSCQLRSALFASPPLLVELTPYSSGMSGSCLAVGEDDPRADDVMVKQLQRRHG